MFEIDVIKLSCMHITRICFNEEKLLNSTVQCLQQLPGCHMKIIRLERTGYVLCNTRVSKLFPRHLNFNNKMVN